MAGHEDVVPAAKAVDLETLHLRVPVSSGITCQGCAPDMCATLALVARRPLTMLVLCGGVY